MLILQKPPNEKPWLWDSSLMEVSRSQLQWQNALSFQAIQGSQEAFR
jgi:hypothetical protein